MGIHWPAAPSERRVGRVKDASPLTDQASVVVWEKIREAYYASIKDASGAVRFFLVVEEIHGRCHWSVWRWRPGESVLDAGHGSTGTPQQAMRLAEQAAT